MAWIRFCTGSSLACCLVLAGTQLVSADPPRVTVEVRPGADAAPAPQTRRASEIIGAEVSLRGGRSIGKVEDIVFSDDGYADYLVVQTEGKYVLVPWSASRVDYGRRVVGLEIQPERFREVPTFTRDSWPNVYDPTYQKKIYTYYGVEPTRRDQRFDRKDDRKEDRKDDRKDDRRGR